MKMKFLCLLAFALAPFFTFAQGVITVFSEDGDKFYLVLNGVKQNNVPQTNVRVDGLTSDYYSGKVIFEDQSKPEITKMMNTKDAGTGQFAEVTFKIKKTKDGELKLRYFGMTPVPVNYTPPADMYVAHYGQAPASQPAASSVTQTTVTTTNPSGVNMNVGAGGVSMSVNMGDPSNGNGGINMNVNVNDPAANTTVTQTTTTTTSSYNSSSTTDNGSYSSQQQPAAQAGCQYPMAPSSFNSAKSTISKASFEDTKMSTAKSILSSNCVNTDQVVQICNLFSFEKTKLDFAKYAYSKTVDKGNYFKVGNVFTFDASKTDLNNFISNGGQ